MTTSNSRRTLERRFHLALDRGIASQIRRERLERARYLLLQTSLSMAEVAGRAGFGDQYQFSTAFRRSFGLPPSAFRDQLYPGPTAGRGPGSRPGQA